MNKTIWKYELKITDTQLLEIPKDAEILSVQFQLGILCLWVLVNPKNDLEERTIEVFGTGHNVQCDMGIERKYIGTVQDPAMDLVWHVFERIN